MLTVKEFNEQVNTKHPVNVDDCIALGWWDWFCRPDSLVRRTDKVADFLGRVIGPKAQKLGVGLKNCCPASNHPTYDMIQLVDLQREEVVYAVSLNDKREDAPVVLYGQENDFKDALAVGRAAVLIRLNAEGE